MGGLRRLFSLRGMTIGDGFWISLAKLFFLPRRMFTIHTNLGRFLFKDSVARTSYGLFLCRKRSEDLGIVSESFESEMLQLFKPAEGDTVVDCGAHIGKYTILASELVGKDGKVIAIEPLPENYGVLKKNIELNGCKNVIPLDCAVCNKDEKVKLYEDRYNTASTLKAKEGKFVEVDGCTLDSVFKKKGLDRIDWLKIDVEGAEAEVMLGASKILKEGKVQNIFIESSTVTEWMPLVESKYEVKRLFGDYYHLTRR